MDAYRELLLWQKAMDLTESIYQSTCQFPNQQRNILATQLCQTAILIPCLIATGSMRSAAEFLRTLNEAHCILRHLEVQTLLAQRLHYWSVADLTDILGHIANVQRLLDAFFQSLGPPGKTACHG